MLQHTTWRRCASFAPSTFIFTRDGGGGYLWHFRSWLYSSRSAAEEHVPRIKCLIRLPCVERIRRDFASDWSLTYYCRIRHLRMHFHNCKWSAKDLLCYCSGLRVECCGSFCDIYWMGFVVSGEGWDKWEICKNGKLVIKYSGENLWLEFVHINCGIFFMDNILW